MSSKKGKKKSVTSPRAKTTWSEEFRNRVKANGQYIQIKLDAETGEPVKKTALMITGAEKRWEKEPDFVYNPVSRLCGPRKLVEKVTKKHLSGILDAVSNTKWKNLKTVADVMDQSYTAENFEENDNYKKEVTAQREAKEKKSAKVKAGVSRGAFNVFDLVDIFSSFPKVEKERATEGKKAEGRRGGKANTGVRALLARARQNNELLDVSQIQGPQGSNCRRIKESVRRKGDLKTAPGVDGMIIYSNNRTAWVKALTLLSRPESEGGAGYAWYKKYIPAWGDKSVTGEITSEQMKKEKKGASTKKATKKKEESEDEESEEEEDEEEEASVKPMKKSSKKSGKKTEDEDEEEEPSEKKTKRTLRSEEASEKKTSPREKKSSPREKKSESLPEPSREAAEAVKEEKAASRTTSPAKSTPKEEEKPTVARRRARKQARDVGSPRGTEPDE